MQYNDETKQWDIITDDTGGIQMLRDRPTIDMLVESGAAADMAYEAGRRLITVNAADEHQKRRVLVRTNLCLIVTKANGTMVQSDGKTKIQTGAVIGAMLLDRRGVVYRDKTPVSMKLLYNTLEESKWCIRLDRLLYWLLCRSVCGF